LRQRPCGVFNDPRRDCSCSRQQIARYLAKISGPLLDRIDLQVEVPALAPHSPCCSDCLDHC